MSNDHYKRLSQDKRVQIAVEMEQRNKTGDSVGDIAQRYNVSKKHCYALENKHQIIPEMDDLERSGRPPKVTPILERRIVRETMKNPFDSSLKMVKTLIWA